jgi:hypothetical protein
MAVKNEEPKKTDLERFIQRTPFLAGKAMRADCQPVMDVTIAWPLAPQLSKTTAAATAGTNTTTLVMPDTGTHVVVDFANFTTSAPVLGQTSVLALQEKNTPLQPIPLQTVQLAPGRTIVPLVGGFVVGTDGLALTGMRRVYVPAGYMLVHSYTGAIGGETLTFEFSIYVFAETQPVAMLL